MGLIQGASLRSILDTRRSNKEEGQKGKPYGMFNFDCVPNFHMLSMNGYSIEKHISVDTGTIKDNN